MNGPLYRLSTDSTVSIVGNTISKHKIGNYIHVIGLIFLSISCYMIVVGYTPLGFPYVGWLTIIYGLLYMIPRRHDITTKMDIEFFEDYMVINRPNMQTDSDERKNLTEKIYYNSIKRCQYDVLSNDVLFMCDYEYLYSIARRNGKKSTMPASGFAENTTLTINFDDMPQDEVIKLLESYINQEVKIINNKVNRGDNYYVDNREK